MKKIIMFTYLLIFSNIYSQITNIEYLVENSNLKQKFILDIDNEKSYFYSDEYCKNNTEEIFNYVIIENNNKSNIFIYHDQLENLKVYYTQPINLVWELTKEEKIVENFRLYKATTSYKNKKWIAWYNNDIPINSGPFIFSKLPGLIYEIETDNLKISLISITKNNENCIQISKKENPIDKESYGKYNKELLKILKEGYRKNTNVFDNITLQSLFEESLKKDLFREYL